jgi:hypothetical protein
MDSITQSKDVAMRTSAACLAVIAVVAAGCSRGGSSTATSSPTVRATTPTPTPSRTGPLTTGAGVLPGEKPPVEPEMAKEHNEEGAFAFAAYFIQALSWSIATTDPYLLNRISAASCAPCKRYVDGLNELRTKGQSQQGGRPSIATVKVATGHFSTDAEHAFEFRLDESAAVILPSASRTKTAHKDVRSIVFVSWIDRRWQVVGQAAS